MRSAIIIVGGLVVLGLFAFAGWRFAGGPPGVVTGAKIFLPIWLLAALLNMWMGVAKAGYTVAEELPIFLAIFGIPAVAAVFLWWKYSTMLKVG